MPDVFESAASRGTHGGCEMTAALQEALNAIEDAKSACEAASYAIDELSEPDQTTPQAWLDLRDDLIRILGELRPLTAGDIRLGGEIDDALRELVRIK